MRAGIRNHGGPPSPDLDSRLHDIRRRVPTHEPYWYRGQQFPATTDEFRVFAQVPTQRRAQHPHGQAVFSLRAHHGGAAANVRHFRLSATPPDRVTEAPDCIMEAPNRVYHREWTVSF